MTGTLTDEAAQVLLDWEIDETHQWVAAAPKIGHLRRHRSRVASNSAIIDNATDALHDLLTPLTYPEP
ncbi:MAG: hypothetical protein J7M39_00210 [Anaerolineae bacterium]|nr:hypothetical protein [Anaerolineae bacterium]